jgi:hypothetical protein
MSPVYSCTICTWYELVRILWPVDSGVIIESQFYTLFIWDIKKSAN